MAYGQLTGCLTRGGTLRQHLQIQQNYQRTQMLAALKCLLDEIGDDDYQAWVDANIEDNTSSSDIIFMARAELDGLVTCTCRPDAGGTCKACKHALDKRQGEELPY